MPKCLNDKTRTYKGTEPSPTGRGFCGRAEKEGTLMRGRDGKTWRKKNGAWRRLSEEEMKRIREEEKKEDEELERIYQETNAVLDDLITDIYQGNSLSKYSDEVLLYLFDWNSNADMGLFGHERFWFRVLNRDPSEDIRRFYKDLPVFFDGFKNGSLLWDDQAFGRLWVGYLILGKKYNVVKKTKQYLHNDEWLLENMLELDIEYVLSKIKDNFLERFTPVGYWSPS